MSRNRRQGAGGSVRGPASALTSFLAGLGVEPSAPLTTWGNSSSIPAATDEAQPDESGATSTAVDTPIDTAGPSSSRVSNDGDETPAPPAKRFKRATSIDSDDLDAAGGSAPPSGPRVPSQPLKAVGEFMDCGECTLRFTVTSYTKEHPAFSSTWLCVKCCWALGIDPFEKAKKAPKAKAAPKKDERNKIVHYEQRKGVLPLSEMCIQLIGRCIEDVDQLGDIGAVNMDKVCRIISKNRQLTPETASLFYSVERTELSMYDCTHLKHESYVAMSQLCPGLEQLNLNLCGRLTTEAVAAWAKNLKHLRRLDLNGPFLVRKEGWHAFFKAVAKRLDTFRVTQSPRLDSESIETLVKSCPSLVELRLAEVGQLDDVCLASIGKLKKLARLDLSSPGTTLSQEAIDTLLQKIGAGLTHLDLSDNPALGDELLASIASHCSKLRHLSLRGLHNLSDEAVAAFFDKLEKARRPGLESIDLEKGDDLEGQALRALVKHSARSIENLSILGWRKVDPDAVSNLKKCSSLKHLNIGWCRAVTDYSLKDILDSCEQIKSIKVWGCNQLTDAVPRKKGVSVIGIETHSI